jgi:high-affinity iron transporter
LRWSHRNLQVPVGDWPTFANIAVVYTAGKNAFEAAENIWEGVFALIASIIITIMGAALLRVSKLQDKWRNKIRKVLEDKDTKPAGGRFKRWSEKYAMFILPFITVLREGIEAVLFIAGVGIGLPATSIPLAAITGLGAGALIGYLIYKGGNKTSLQIFLVVSTCFLYLVAAGLFSKGVWNLEQVRSGRDEVVARRELTSSRIRGSSLRVRALRKQVQVQAATTSERACGTST